MVRTYCEPGSLDKRQSVQSGRSSGDKSCAETCKIYKIVEKIRAGKLNAKLANMESA